MKEKSTTYHHGNLKEALLDSASELLEKQGSHALSLRGVAKHAGVSHTAPYRHYADKDALLAAICERGFRELEQSMKKTVAEETKAKSKLIPAGKAYVRLAWKNPERSQLMFGARFKKEDCPKGLKDAGDRAFNTLVEIIENEQVVGRIKPGDSQKFALAAWATVHGLSQFICSGRLEMSKQELEKVSEEVCLALFEGLKTQ